MSAALQHHQPRHHLTSCDLIGSPRKSNNEKSSGRRRQPASICRKQNGITLWLCRHVDSFRKLRCHLGSTTAAAAACWLGLSRPELERVCCLSSENVHVQREVICCREGRRRFITQRFVELLSLASRFRRHENTSGGFRTDGWVQATSESDKILSERFCKPLTCTWPYKHETLATMLDEYLTSNSPGSFPQTLISCGDVTGASQGWNNKSRCCAVFES